MTFTYSVCIDICKYVILLLYIPYSSHKRKTDPKKTGEEESLPARTFALLPQPAHWPHPWPSPRPAPEVSAYIIIQAARNKSVSSGDKR